MSEYIGKPIPVENWKSELIKQKYPPDLPTAFDTWNKYQKDNKLICIYKNRNVKDGPLMLSEPIAYKRLYLWIGGEFNSLVDKKDKNSNSHAALLFFDDNKIILITILPKTKLDSAPIFVQEISLDEFFQLTYFVFQIMNNPRY